MEIRKIQLLEYDVLKVVDRYCRKNKIKYSLSSGTLIGAIRHQGFIPWDDDIDLFMMRDEYEKFIVQVKRDNYYIAENIKVLLPEKDDCFYPFIKVVNENTIIKEEKIEEKFPMGIWVDIFPLDYCDTSEFCTKNILIKHMNYVTELLRTVAIDERQIKRLMRKVYLIFKSVLGKNWQFYKKQLMKIPNKGDQKYVGAFSWPLYENVIYPENLVKDYCEIKFEDGEFMAFKEYDKLLQITYGNYMQLPPIEERKTHKITVNYV